MTEFSIKQSLSFGWAKFKERPWFLMGTFLAVIGFVMITTGQAMYTALAYIAYAGYTLLLLRIAQGNNVVFDDLFEVDKRWIYFVFLVIMKTFAIMLGFLCLIIPGIYLSLKWMFAEILVLDKGMRPMEALAASSEMTHDKKWKLFGFSLVMGLVILLGLVLLVVGVIPASIVVTFAFLRVYLTLSKPAEV